MYLKQGFSQLVKLLQNLQDTKKMIQTTNFEISLGCCTPSEMRRLSHCIVVVGQNMHKTGNQYICFLWDLTSFKQLALRQSIRSRVQCTTYVHDPFIYYWLGFPCLSCHFISTLLWPLWEMFPLNALLLLTFSDFRISTWSVSKNISYFMISISTTTALFSNTGHTSNMSAKTWSKFLLGEVPWVKQSLPFVSFDFYITSPIPAVGFSNTLFRVCYQSSRFSIPHRQTINNCPEPSTSGSSRNGFKLGKTVVVLRIFIKRQMICIKIITVHSAQLKIL